LAEDDNKTEEPTEKRRTESLERDGGPVSREVGAAGALIVIAMFLTASAAKPFAELAHFLTVFLEDPGSWRLRDGEDATALLNFTIRTAFKNFGLFALALCAVGVAASVLQNTPNIVTSRLEPDFSRVSPLAGFRRLFTMQTLMELIKGALKIALAGFALYAAVGGVSTALIAIHSEPAAVPELLRRLCFRAALFCALMTCVIAVADIFLTRHNWQNNLKMSKQEVKEEMKESEGDLAFKARMRNIARARIRRRMMTNVPKATVVVTNPTHYAIALRYVRDMDSAPKVLAKGQGQLALKIREIAELHNIPIVENKTLARSLYAATEIDQLIPKEFYRAVAEIIIYLDSKTTKTRSNKKASGPLKPPRR
jgi:flagellar biosynthesis protein FlhB